MQQQIGFKGYFVYQELMMSCSFRISYIGDVVLAKMSGTVTDIDNKVTEYVLPLATLGNMTRNRNNPVCVVQPKVAKASTMVSIACHCRWHYCDKLCQCKHSFRCDQIHNKHSYDFCHTLCASQGQFRYPSPSPSAVY
jgi:hypothetical protein